MQLLEERIRSSGKIGEGDILKVDSFLNHQIDVSLLDAMGAEFRRLFEQEGVNKILTIEASGIAIAALTAKHFGCPLVFAKKSKTLNIFGDVYVSKVYSYTHQTEYDITVSRAFLNPGDKVLIIDDFLALGNALHGLIDLCNQAGAKVAGVGIAIEKAFQQGGDALRSEGIRIESLARIASLSVQDGIRFVGE